MSKKVLQTLLLAFLTLGFTSQCVIVSGRRGHNKACKQKCKGLKGQERADCQRNCR